MLVKVPHPECELWVNAADIQRLYVGRRAVPGKNGNGSKVFHVTLQLDEGHQEVVYFPTFEEATQFADSIVKSQSQRKEDAMLEIKEIPAISVKRAISPDGRVNSISFFLQVPVTAPAHVDTDKLNSLIALLNRLAEQWQAEALAPRADAPATAPAPAPAPAQNAHENNGENGETRIVATRIRFVDKVASKFDPNGQYRIKYHDPLPPLYVSLDRIADILADFKVTSPDRLRGLPVHAHVDDASGRVRRISPVR